MKCEIKSIGINIKVSELDYDPMSRIYCYRNIVFNEGLFVAY